MTGNPGTRWILEDLGGSSKTGRTARNGLITRRLSSTKAPSFDACLTRTCEPRRALRQAAFPHVWCGTIGACNSVHGGRGQFTASRCPSQRQRWRLESLEHPLGPPFSVARSLVSESVSIS